MKNRTGKMDRGPGGVKMKNGGEGGAHLSDGHTSTGHPSASSSDPGHKVFEFPFQLAQGISKWYQNIKVYNRTR